MKARRDRLKTVITSVEKSIDLDIAYAVNWALIGQENATTLGHVDTAGLCTGIKVLNGTKIWCIRNTAFTENREMVPDDIRYWDQLEARDVETELPGGKAAWTVLVLFPGDILCVAQCIISRRYH